MHHKAKATSHNQYHVSEESGLFFFFLDKEGMFVSFVRQAGML